ncbi:hypothetical protein RF11_09189 [Thelohanellus kitauei]|uniref:Uncharacterized protein n=1 Tax=Thelohanellus kitauei TaxID=669202 RepID=A0A0C2J066_THEKT|nr:hypothetical protein RF11_09189 [Thelohanellus kitauei]
MARKMNKEIQVFSRKTGLSTWLFRFELLAESEEWSQTKQSSLLPTYCDDDVLTEYQKSGISSHPPSEKKLVLIKTWMNNLQSGQDTLSSDLTLFNSMKMAPGQNIFQYKSDLENTLKEAKPMLSETDRNFFYKSKNTILSPACGIGSIESDGNL